MSSADALIDGVSGRSVAVTLANPALPDCPLVYVNAAFGRLTGYPEAACLGVNCRFLSAASKDDAERVRLRASVDSRAPLEVSITNRRRDGALFLNHLFLDRLEFDSGEELLIGCQFAETPVVGRALARLQAEDANRRSELARLKAAAEAALRRQLHLSRQSRREVAHSVIRSAQRIASRLPRAPAALS